MDLKIFSRCVVLIVVFLSMYGVAHSQTRSTYTKLDIERDCEFYQSDEMGGAAICPGFMDYPVYFAEGDLRQMIRFGHVERDTRQWESFAQFNSINDTIEWRLEAERPFATILRWFIENNEGGTGNNGQVLVVSTVATLEIRQSCVAGYVDARANKNANKLARQIADQIVPHFECGVDVPVFHGIRGNLSGDPARLVE